MDLLTPGQRPQTPRPGFRYETTKTGHSFETTRDRENEGDEIDRSTAVITLAPEVRRAHLNDILQALLDHGVLPEMVDTVGKFGERGTEYQIVFLNERYCQEFLHAKNYIAIQGTDGRGHRCPVTSIARRAIPVRIHWLRARATHAEVAEALSSWGEVLSMADEWGGQVFKVKTGTLSAMMIPHKPDVVPDRLTVKSGNEVMVALVTKPNGAPTCFKCRGPHYKSECPQIKGQGAVAQAGPAKPVVQAPATPKQDSGPLTYSKVVAGKGAMKPQGARQKDGASQDTPNFTPLAPSSAKFMPPPSPDKLGASPSIKHQAQVSLRPNGAPPPPPQSAPSPAKGAEPMEAADGSLKRKSSSEDGEWQRAKTRGRSLSKDRNGTPTRNRHSSSGSQP
jgi:hypothetical protein